MKMENTSQLASVRVACLDLRRCAFGFFAYVLDMLRALVIDGRRRGP
jgi:hypothetical protein